jgi:cell division protein ZapB
MINELDALESKIVQVTSLCRTLRAENSRLKQQLASAEGDRQGLVERMELARSRLEELAQQLPAAKASV